jgi:adenylate kinase family enzyme
MSTDGVDESHVKVWLILGPSGVGKSDFGGWLHTELNWLHLEIDRSDGDGIDLNALRPEWDAFLKQNNAQLAPRTRQNQRCADVCEQLGS